MSNIDRERLRQIKTFPSLVKYLRDELDWPIESDDFEDLTFEYEPEELGIDPKNAAKIDKIMQLRPLVSNQPWGIFFVKFEPKQLPVVVLRRILRELVMKKRVSANRAGQATWELHDLLFISNYGEGEQRQITFAHFSENTQAGDLPTLKVLGWDETDTARSLDHVHNELHSKLNWPEDEEDLEGWRKHWGSAFVLRHHEVITTSKQLASRLAELAHDIRVRVNAALAVETEKGPLRTLMAAFKESLIHDLNNDDFADMYAQTIAYGLLSARVSRPAGLVADNLADMVPITNPFLKELMETFLQIGGRKKVGKNLTGIDFDELGINDVVELLRDANMDAVIRDFRNRNRNEDPITHFYEGFAKEYDPIDKVKRGEFYTPWPVVSFIVHNVDEILENEFGLNDGLADTITWGEMIVKNDNLKIPSNVTPDHPFVNILDPATGTGTFLVEVISVIHKRMMKKWKNEGHNKKIIGQLWNEYVPKYLLPRLYGFELKMAPYTIAHMTIGLKLLETGYKFESSERIRVYLTNALHSAHEIPKQDDWTLSVPALAHEAEEVFTIKKDQRFTVVIGNPPYAKLSSNREEAAEAFVKPFKEVVRTERNIQPLSDDYLKFMGHSFSLSENVGRFVFGMITNRGYLVGLIHRGVRQTISSSWSNLWIVDMHGDSNVREKTPTGVTNDNIFDIQQGVAITLGVKKADNTSLVRRVDNWGTRSEKQDKLKKLSLTSAEWITCDLREPNFFFDPPESNILNECTYPISSVMPVTNTGIKTHRDSMVIDFDKDILINRIESFVDPEKTDSEIRLEFFGTKGRGCYKPGDNRDWAMSEARRKLQSKNKPLKNYVIELEYRPFDRRNIFYSADIIDFTREEIMHHMEGGENIGLITTRQVPNGDFCHALVTRLPIEMKTCSYDRGTNLFPLFLKNDSNSLEFSDNLQHNLSPVFLQKLCNVLNLRCDKDKGLPDRISPIDILGMIYAFLYSPSYRRRYATLLKIGFPPIPIPKNLKFFQEISRIGTRLISLHLLESVRLDEQVNSLIGDGQFQVEKVSFTDKTVWINKNKTKGFKGVTEEVWNFHIGGYQVCEKWLKDRQAKGGKNPRPGRVLTNEDIKHYQKIIVAISETIRIMNEIDEVIEQHGGWPDAFATVG